MRATSPLDSLGATVAYEPIPQPRIPVGTQLDLSKAVYYNKPWYIRRLRTTLIREMRETITRMQAQGYFPEMQGKKLLPAHKKMLRDSFEFMRTADGVFVAGHAPSESQSRNNIANQCYLAGGPGYGRMTFQCYVMFRKNVDGKELIFTFTKPLIGEDDALSCVVAPLASKATPIQRDS